MIIRSQIASLLGLLAGMAVAAGGAGGTEATEAWHGVLQTRIARGKPWEVVCPLSAPATPLKLPRELQVRALERDPRRMPSGPPSFEIRCGAVGGDVRGHRKYVEYLKYLAAGLQGRSGPKAAVVVLPGVNLFLMPPEDYSAVTADTPLVVMWRESGQGGPPQFVSASAAGMNSTEDGPPAKKRSRVEVQNSSSVTPTGAAGTFAKLEPVALAALRGTAVTRLVDALEAAITEASGFAGEAPLVRAAMTHGVAAAVRPWVGHWLLSQRALAAVSSIGDAVLPSAPARDPQLRAELEYAGLMDVDAPLTALEQACEKEAAALVAKHRELSQSSEPWHSGVDVSEDPAGDGCILTCEGHQVRLSEEEAQRMAQLALGAAASGAAPSGHELMAATFASVARADILHGRTTSSTEAIGTLLVPSPVCDVLASQLGVHHECFTTPIDTYFTSFCSAAPDVDAPFGSAGDFFRFRPTYVGRLAFAKSCCGLLDTCLYTLPIQIGFLPCLSASHAGPPRCYGAARARSAGADGGRWGATVVFRRRCAG